MCVCVCVCVCVYGPGIYVYGYFITLLNLCVYCINVLGVDNL